MNISKNKIVTEQHGCVICANLFNVLVVYTPEGKLLDCTVTSPGGHILQNKQRLLVACDIHTAGEIKPANKDRKILDQAMNKKE
jgi:hypothetical protein